MYYPEKKDLELKKYNSWCLLWSIFFSVVSIQQKLALFHTYAMHFIDMENESATYGRSLSLVIRVPGFPSHLFMSDFCKVLHFTDNQPRQ